MNRTKETIRLRGRAAGFTLIEMLVVIFILSILVTLVVGIGKYIYEEAARRQTQATMAIVMNAIEAFWDIRKDDPSVASSSDAYPPDKHTPTPPPPESEIDLSCAVLLQHLTGRIDADFDILTGLDDDRRATSEVKAAQEKLLQLPQDAFVNGYDYSAKYSYPTSAKGPAILDGFGNPMRYNRSGGLGGRPVAISPGPDGLFGTNDKDSAGTVLLDVAGREEDNIRSDEQ